MKITLTVAERIGLSGILPTRGKYQFLRSVEQLRRRLAFNDQEAKAIELKQEGERLLWNAKADPMVEFEIGEICKTAIVQRLKELDSGGTLQNHQMTLYEKFVDKTHFEPVPLAETEVSEAHGDAPDPA